MNSMTIFLLLLLLLIIVMFTVISCGMPLLQSAFDFALRYNHTVCSCIIFVFKI